MKFVYHIFSFPKALLSAFFLLYSAYSHAATSSSCPLPEGGRWSKVAVVNDGDTVTLASGVRVRIIGIDAPEIDYRHLDKSEPLALEAREQLRKRLGKHMKIRLIPGREAEDRYGRLLAHVAFEDGVNLAAWSLRHGWAQLMIIPPNDDHWQCYRQQELLARREKRGIWQHSYYLPKPAASVSAKHTGSIRIRGEITRVIETRRYHWLVLDGRVHLGIRRHDDKRFPEDFESFWLHKRIEAAGWLYASHGKLRMRIRHPAQILLLDNQKDH